MGLPPPHMTPPPGTRSKATPNTVSRAHARTHARTHHARTAPPRPAPGVPMVVVRPGRQGEKQVARLSDTTVPRAGQAALEEHRAVTSSRGVWFGLGQRLPRTTKPTVSATVPARLDWVGRSWLSRSQGVPDC